jgi:flagella basal body P-ring formation protein FlgA
MRRFAFLVTLLAAAPAFAGAQAVLRHAAVVPGEFFTLGEVADVSAPELAALRIGRSPRAGTALAVRRADVEALMARLKPGLALRFSGAERVVVRRGPLQALAPSRIEAAAEDALRAFLAERFPRFEVALLRAAARAPLPVPQGRLELKARVPDARVPGRTAAVWIDVLVDERHYQSLPVEFAVQAWQPVLRARRGLQPESPLEAAAFEVREAQVAGLPEAPVPVHAALEVLRLRRALPAGEVLTWVHARSAPAVSRNDTVRVRASVGGVSVEAPAIAMHDARPGERLRVRSSSTGQTYAARVTARGAVEASWR